MHRKLLINAYEKAKKEQGLIKKTHVTEFLSEYITNQTKEPYGEKIIRINYNKAISSTNEKVELKSFAAESLCHYLGDKTYLEYLAEAKRDKLQVETKSFFKKNRLRILFITLVIIIGIIIVRTIALNSQRWMIWEEDHYIEVEFDTEKYSITDLKLYKEERIEKFKKIEPNCNTIFFKSNGTENLWYGKNKNKKLDFFTSFGLHPETGKTLKPITNYMIEKYICKDTKDN